MKTILVPTVFFAMARFAAGQHTIAVSHHDFSTLQKTCLFVIRKANPSPSLPNDSYLDWSPCQR